MTAVLGVREGAAARLPYRISHLDVLESESIHVFREVAGEFERPVLLFSGGKDSIVMLHLTRKAFWPAPVPFTLLHVDTGHNFPEVIEYRDRTVERYGLRLVVARVQDYIDAGRLRERPDGTRNPLQTVPLLDAIGEHRFDAVFGGGRRDEEKARAKERVFSLRDEFGQWDPFSHQREVFLRGGMWLAPGGWGGPKDGERVQRKTVRYRTVGDMSCTGAVESTARTVADVITEVAASRLGRRRQEHPGRPAAARQQVGAHRPGIPAKAVSSFLARRTHNAATR